jgi:4-hydroxybenzoyl-CoA thioesterase
VALSLPPDAFTIHDKIRFSDCDPAGIVFYPTYFVRISDLFEDWMESTMGLSFQRDFVAGGVSLPTVHLETDFKAVRMQGQRISLTLILTHVGNSSIRYTVVAHDDGLEIFRARVVAVLMSKQTSRPMALPANVRRQFEAYREKCAGWRED